MYKLQAKSVNNVNGMQISKKNERNPASTVPESSSMTGVLKNVWPEVSEEVANVVCKVHGLTARKVPW